MDIEYLKTILSYDQDTGIFTWRKNMPPRGKAGQIAGYDKGKGYQRISVHGKHYYSHRLAYAFVTGFIPNVIDHIDGDPSNNRFKNLRSCDQNTNMANQKGKSGVRKRYGRWYARFSHKHLGVYDTKEEALAARKKAQIEAAGLDPDEH